MSFALLLWCTGHALCLAHSNFLIKKKNFKNGTIKMILYNRKRLSFGKRKELGRVVKNIIASITDFSCLIFYRLKKQNTHYAHMLWRSTDTGIKWNDIFFWNSNSFSKDSFHRWARGKLCSQLKTDIEFLPGNTRFDVSGVRTKVFFFFFQEIIGPRVMCGHLIAFNVVGHLSMGKPMTR